MSDARYGMFERFGFELELMIADAQSLNVRPIADRLLLGPDGEPQSEIEAGPLVWSNELVLHVLEMKTGEPAPSLHGLADVFQASVRDANARLAQHGARLLPGGMHPTMDPATEMRLWPHEYGAVYETFNRIFDCRGHGWSNLQSTHLNLPFRDDDEFGRLHAAIRVLLPLMPALAAASPVYDGRSAPVLDARMHVYKNNAARVPSVSGYVVPEPAGTEGEYRDRILSRIYDDLAPLDPDGVLRHEWVNARGAIARFDRGTIEIRVLDGQECPLADFAIAGAIASAVRMLAEEETASARAMDAQPTEFLAAMLDRTIEQGEAAVIEGRAYLELFGWRRGGSCRARELWSHLVERGLEDGPDQPRWEHALETILFQGCLARRILRRLGPAPTSLDILTTWHGLAACLEQGALLTAD